MNLSFITLEIEHFRCFAAKQRFNLSPSPGLWFLRGINQVEPQLGANGAGKSSVWEALCWSIYGRTSQNLKNPDIKPWVGKGTPKGTLILKIDDEEHSITRIAKTNGLQIDGKEVGPDEAAKLVGLPFEVLTNTLFLAQGKPLLFDLAPREKLQLFTEVLPLERWEERSDRAAKRTRELEDLEAEITGEILGLDSALKQTEELLVRTQQDSANWEKGRSSRTAALAKEIKDLSKKLETQELELGKVDLSHDEAWVRLREMREDLPKLQDCVNSTQRSLDTWELRQDTLEKELKALRTELGEDSETCPTCGQSLDGTALAKHKADVRRKIANTAAAIHRSPPEELSEAFNTAQEKYAQLRVKLHTAEQETDALQTRINFLKPAVERQKAEISALRQTQKAYAEEGNPHIDQVQALRRQKAKHGASLTALKDDKIKAQRQIERTHYWVKGFKEVALYLIEEVLEELEAVTNAILGEVGLVGWGVRYVVERETKSGTLQRGINLTIIPPYDIGNASIKWESWSGGEGQRLRLVGALALGEVLLRHAGVSTNLEVLDEPAKYVSGAGVEELCSYLSQRAKSQGKTIWLVDHLAREGQVFAGTTAVTKTAKGSVLSQ